MTASTSPTIDVAQPARLGEGLHALLDGVGVSRLDETAWISVLGEDRVRWMNGMTTNSIQQLKPGEGCYNFSLSAQGRIQGDGYVFAAPTELLLETARSQAAKLIELLDRFIIMDDVELKNAPRYGLLCAGPKAAETLKTLGIEVDELGPLTRHNVTWRGIELSLINAYAPLVPRFEVWIDSSEQRETVWSAVIDGGAVAVEAAAVEQLRMLEGTPRYGVDIRDRELPQETGQTRALHFAKGCYLGQEIVERIRSRGAVHRTFQAFRLEGATARAGDVLSAESKAVGELTSVASVPLASGAIQLGLGYIRREALERRVALEYPGGVATAVDVPYCRPAP